jgi:hypothetical protein
MSALLLLAALLAALLASALLALSQRKHWQALTGGPSCPGPAPRRLGWWLIATSLAVTLLRDGASFGALAWPMLLGCSGLMTAMVLAFAPHALRPLARLFMVTRRDRSASSAKHS